MVTLSFCQRQSAWTSKIGSMRLRAVVDLCDLALSLVRIGMLAESGAARRAITLSSMIPRSCARAWIAGVMRCWESRNNTLDGMVAISLSGLMQSAFPPFGMWRNTGREASFREWMLPICRVLPSPLGSQGKNPRAELSWSEIFRQSGTQSSTSSGPTSLARRG